MANVDKTLLNEYTSNIGQRLFAYTYHGTVINATIANQFKKSLIFLGYEGQIWSPLTNTYVGIGKTAYDITTAYTVLAHEKIDALNTALTSSLVSGIYANWGEDDWATAQGIGENGLPSVAGDNAWNTKIGASNKIVLKGIGDYDVNKDQRMDAEYAHVTDLNATEEDRAKLLAAKIPFTTYSQWATSGITVSLEKGENDYRWERLVDPRKSETGENGKIVFWAKGKGIPSLDGFTFDTSDTKDPVQPMSKTHFTRVFNAKGEQVYRNGKNVLSIDDKQTWSYITARTSYAMDFAKEYTNSEVNRIYAEILGLEAGQIIPVSYNHIWEVAANDAALNNVEGDSYVAVALPTDKIYLKRVGITNDGGIDVTETDNNVTFSTTIDGASVTVYHISKAGQTDVEYVMGEDTSMGKDVTFDSDTRVSYTNGTEVGFDGAFTPGSVTKSKYNLAHVYKVVRDISEVTANNIYYTVNKTASVADNINLADGINTLKEVAHVLDLITNGSMDPNNPENTGIELAYSIAQNHVDIVNLDARLDKLEAGENAVRSLREEVNGTHLDLHLASTVNNDDKYYQDVTISATLNMAYTHSAADTVARETVFVPGWEEAANGDITLTYTVDGTTTVPSLVDRTHDGLVTTQWALSYGVELRQAIVANDIELNKHLAYAHSYALINALDGTYTTSNSKLVCGYTQTNGAVAVSYRELPTDHIEASATIWGESGDTALKVYTEVAGNNVEELVALQTPLFTKVANGEYLKLTDAECGAVTDTSVVGFFALKDGVMVAITTDNFGGGTNSDLTRRVKGLDHKDHIVAYKQIDKYVRVDSADLTIDANGVASGAQLYVLATSGQPAAQVKYISAAAVHHNDETYADNDGSNTFRVTAHITKISDATETNSGLADAYDVKNAIDNIFGWVDLSEWASNNPLNRTNTVQD